MEYWLSAAALGVLMGMALALVRLLRGPGLYDRVLASNVFGAKTVAFLCIFSLIIGRADGVDIALLYALINFITTIAVLKFFHYRTLRVALSPRRFSYRQNPEDVSGEGQSEEQEKPPSGEPPTHKRKEEI